MDPDDNPFSTFFGKPGEAVPEVDPADMKALHKMEISLKERRGSATTGIGIDILRRVCSPGANIGALAHRLSMIKLLEMILEATWSGGQLTDDALEVAAQIPMQWMEVGKPINRFPSDEAQFLTEVFARSQNLLPKQEG